MTGTSHISRLKKLFCGTVFAALMLTVFLFYRVNVNTVFSNDNIKIYDYTLKKDFFPAWVWDLPFIDLSMSLESDRRKGAAKLPFYSKVISTNMTANWVQFHRHIREFSLYDPADPAVNGLLHDMATLPIAALYENIHGRQLKVNVKFEDGGWALVKPKTTDMGERHNVEIAAFHLDRTNTGDRHYAEIAAFHLDRILGYYRVPPTVGRQVNIKEELAPKFIAEFRQTVFTSEDGMTCFNVKCRRSSVKERRVCGSPDVLDVSLMHFLPNKRDHMFMTKHTPWKKWKEGHIVPGWVSEEYLCNKTRAEYKSGDPFMMEILDVIYFDMLIDNNDRHHHAFYGYFKNLKKNLILFDNGKGFPNASYDAELHEFLYERGGCCLMKKTTFLKFLKLFLGPEKLSNLLRSSLRSDPLTPVLSESHLFAVDRRLEKIIHFITECFKNNGIDNVIIDDMTPL